MKKTIGLFLSIGLLTTGVVDAKQSKNKEYLQNTHEGWDVRPYEATWSKADPKNGSERRRPARDAADIIVDESEMSQSLKNFRDELVGENAFSGKGVKTGDQLASLIEKYLKRKNPNNPNEMSFATLDNDTKFFLAPLYAVAPLRGIVWRTRKLFEVKELGKIVMNKAIHGQAVQLVRNVIGAIDIYLPTDQWDAAVEFLTEPVVLPKGEKAQFETVFEFQRFIANDYIPGLRLAIDEVKALKDRESEKIYVFDNKMAFGPGVFRDNIKRFIGHGKAEKELVLSALTRLLFDAYVFCAYDQSEMIAYVGNVGRHFGIDLLQTKRNSNEFGMTDLDRRNIVKGLVNKGSWLKRVKHTIPSGPYAGQEFGKLYLAWSFWALSDSVKYLNDAYNDLQSPTNSKMLLNSKYFDGTDNTDIKLAIDNMMSAINGPATYTSRITGEPVTVNLQNFYLVDPPDSLFGLYAIDFEPGNIELTKNGISFRDYKAGRARAWDNNEWSRLVVSAKGQKADYMKTAKRVLNTTKGLGNMFGVIDLYIR
jgi:hypothetical protein